MPILFDSTRRVKPRKQTRFGQGIPIDDASPIASVGDLWNVIGRAVEAVGAEVVRFDEESLEFRAGGRWFRLDHQSDDLPTVNEFPSCCCDPRDDLKACDDCVAKLDAIYDAMALDAERQERLDAIYGAPIGDDMQFIGACG